MILLKDTKIKLSLIGLDCANCANKIEAKLNSLEDIKEVNLNFSFGTLMVELIEPKEIDELKSQIEDIVHSFEPDVKVENYNKDKKKINNNSCGCHYDHEANEHCHEEEHDHSHSGSSKDVVRLIIGAVLFAAGIVFEDRQILGIVLFVVSYLVVGFDVLISALKNIGRGRVFDENFLMAIATVGAFGIGEYPEAVAVMLFYQIGELFQGYAVNKSKKSISELMDIRSDYANLIVNGKEKKVDPEEVNINDTILVKPGERMPLDGIVLEGETTLDTSALTGESVPRNCIVGDEVLSGCINITGVIKVKVTKKYDDSTVARILELVENANSKKASTEKFITKFARIYTPIVVMLAVLVAIIPPLVISDASFSDWLYRALVFLVVSCPCALVVSVPLAIFAGIGAASKKGILIKGGNYLEALKDLDIVVFDKTGTLTKGIFEVSEIEEKNISKDEFIRLATYGESYSNHPIAKSIVKFYGKSIDKDLISNYKEISGNGISVTVDNKNILLGNEKLMKANNIDFEKSDAVGTVVHLVVNNEYKGYVIISDEVKETSIEAIRSLRKIGIKETVMLTGDNKIVADKIGRDIGVDKIYSELLPGDKVEKIEEILSKKKGEEKVAFVGDGINDAPVLARVDIGVAMGGMGSDAAIEAADVVLMKDDPLALVDAFKIAKRTNKILWQNIIFSLGIKILVLILGIFGIATIWEGVFADVGVTLIAVLNSMRALKAR